MKNKPVVLQVLPEMDVGGVERGTFEIAEYLQKEGVKNFVASKGGRLVYNLEKINVTHFTFNLKTKNPIKLYLNSKKLEKIIKENGINVVHARSRAPAWSAYWATKRANVSFVTTFHGTYGLGPFGIKKIYNRVMTYGKLVISISEFIKEHIIKNYHIDENKIRLIHRGVDIEKFSPESVTAERKVSLIRQFNIPEDKPVILLIGRLTHWKGQHLLLEAFSKLKNKNYYAIIAGGDQGRTDYSEYLRKLVEKNNLASNVLITNKVVDDVPAFMSLSAIVASTAIEPEAFGRMAIEGQAMGRIVVASNIGGSLENIVDGKTGILFESGNAQDLADKIDYALSLDEKSKTKMSKAAIQNVKDNFTKEIMCVKTLKVYEEVLK